MIYVNPSIKEDQVTCLLHWINERDSMRVKKEAGKPYPWTDDPILRTYRFCNVHREDDRVTRWIKDNWREPYKDLPDLWFYMVMARLLNQPISMCKLPKPSAEWDRDNFLMILRRHRANGNKVFNAAYMVSTNGTSQDKLVYLVQHILGPAWDNKDEYRPSANDTCEKFAEKIRCSPGMAYFMSGQVTADMKYVEPLRSAPDFNTFAFSGPGSRRGLNRITGRDLKARWLEEDWHDKLLELQDLVNPNVSESVAFLHAQDLQNCLCEFDKYERARLGEGRPKQRYVPF